MRAPQFGARISSLSVHWVKIDMRISVSWARTSMFFRRRKNDLRPRKSPTRSVLKISGSASRWVSLSVLQKMLFFAYCFAVFDSFCTFATCIERCTHSYLLKFPDEPLSRRELKSNETHPWERTLLCVGFIIGCVGFSGPVRDMWGLRLFCVCRFVLASHLRNDKS